VQPKHKRPHCLEEYRFAEAYETVYHTIWDKVADWYVESSKTAYSADTMLWVLEACLVMAHPFAPFVTEAIWQTLDWHPADEDMFITTKWLLHEDYNVAEADKFEQLKTIISEIREVLSAINVRDVALFSEGSHLAEENSDLITKMTPIGYLQQIEEPAGLRLTSTGEHLWIDLSEDEILAYKSTLETKLTAVEESIHALEHRLANESYVANAPEALVDESREELGAKSKQAEHLKHQLKHLG
jgi:valyl-tRNA synthetase